MTRDSLILAIAEASMLRRVEPMGKKVVFIETPTCSGTIKALKVKLTKRTVADNAHSPSPVDVEVPERVKKHFAAHAIVVPHANRASVLLISRNEYVKISTVPVHICEIAVTGSASTRAVQTCNTTNTNGNSGFLNHTERAPVVMSLPENCSLRQDDPTARWHRNHRFRLPPLQSLLSVFNSVRWIRRKLFSRQILVSSSGELQWSRPIDMQRASSDTATLLLRCADQGGWPNLSCDFRQESHRETSGLSLISLIAKPLQASTVGRRQPNNGDCPTKARSGVFDDPTLGGLFDRCLSFLLRLKTDSRDSGFWDSMRTFCMDLPRWSLKNLPSKHLFVFGDITCQSMI